MNYDEVWNILTNSFDKFLYREYDKQKELLNNKYYNIQTYQDNNKTLGFISYWDFGDFIFIEHFAVEKNTRGKGIGKKLLDDVLLKSKLVVLEVEPPETQINKRRIEFYERTGFVLNSYNYFQPPYVKGYPKENLFIMSTKPLSKEKFDDIVNILYSKVYDYKVVKG